MGLEGTGWESVGVKDDSERKSLGDAVRVSVPKLVKLRMMIIRVDLNGSARV
jgi:hypothetical protein